MSIPRNSAWADQTSGWRVPPVLQTCLILAVSAAGTLHAADDLSSIATPTFKQYCYGCHGKAAMAGLNLQQLTSQHSMADSFQHWERVAAAIEEKRMPPARLPQPTDEQRQQAVTWIRARLNEFAQKHAGDPGRVTVRRLTSGEYAYTIQDLTGLELRFDRDFASDSVGGEGFTNFGDVQFMEDANLERYLEAAKRVADHAVIGSGPLQFFDDPGKSGLELSAVSRIQKIYNAHGFRAVAGEGGKPYGLERYGKAFYAAWRYRHRVALGDGKATLASLAAREGLSARFVQHIWTVLHQPSPSYPTSEVVARWKKLPAPNRADGQQDAAVRAESDKVQQFVVDWPRWLFAAGELAAGGQGDERALLLTDASLQANTTQKLKFNLRKRGHKTARVYLSAVPVNPGAADKPVVIWRNPMVRFRGADRGLGTQQPLRALLDEATVNRLAFGKLPDGTVIGPQDFAMVSGGTMHFDVETPEKAGGLELQVEAELVPGPAGDAVLRCTLSDRDGAAAGAPVWALLGNPKGAGFQTWKANVLAFAAQLPQNSHGEPTPSDKDAIPAPFDNTYNQPERDHFHVKLKYYRTDKFLVDKMLDDATRAKLDQAWNDLLASFEYHDAFLRFVATRYKLDLKSVAELDAAQIAALPAEPRKYVQALHADHKAVFAAQKAAQPGQVEDAIRFASQAWRRPLSKTEEAGLRGFYAKLREDPKLDHPKAVKSLLARVLIAPAFLYRLEQPAQVASDKPLSNWELASRLSYFLWASVPDQELRRAAAASELTNPQQLERQVKRMLADPKARRLSTEFFGQWLGFYRFDQYRGVDTMRFPEFTDEVKAAMYDESVSFFEHVVRKDRPVRELLSANYTFLNKTLAKHYGIKKEIASTGQTELVEGANEFQRGGLLRLGAVLTATSAPLRTSPVKRGDWVLRRVLGTPTPPPPADAGSIPADDKSFGGMSVFERLEAHKRNPSCASCHTRIDPLGFPLERYDAVGRWRDQYADGKPIQDASALPDKTQIAGVDGLLGYLQTQEKQVLRTLSHKLLGYALGRTILLSDQPLVERLTTAGSDAHFSKLVTEIVSSRQFRHRREQDEAPPATTSENLAQPAVKNSGEGGL